MVDKSPERLNAVFQALADPTRRAMLRGLADRPQTVSELAAPFAISLAGASKHIQVLERAGLIEREVQGRVHTCRLDPAPLHEGVEWMRHYERFWSQRLDGLEALLMAEDAATGIRKTTSRKSAPTKGAQRRKKP